MRQVALIVAFLAVAATRADPRHLPRCEYPLLLSSSVEGHFGSSYMEAWGKYEYKNGTFVQHRGYTMEYDFVVSDFESSSNPS